MLPESRTSNSLSPIGSRGDLQFSILHRDGTFSIEQSQAVA